MVGLAQGAFEKAVRYSYDRKQFGKAVGDFQGMSFQFAEAATELEAARLLTYNAARLKVSPTLHVRLDYAFADKCRRKVVHSWSKLLKPSKLVNPRIGAVGARADCPRWYSSVIAQKISGNAIEWCGGNGFVRDTGIEKYWRDSKVSPTVKLPARGGLLILVRNNWLTQS